MKTDSLEKTQHWESLKAGGEGNNRRWDGWMASPNRWTWVEQTPGVGDGQGSLVCCSPWGHKESDTTERLNWLTKQCRLYIGPCFGCYAAVVPNHFGARTSFMEDVFPQSWGREGWSRDDSSAFHWLCILFLLFELWYTARHNAEPNHQGLDSHRTGPPRPLTGTV